MAYTPTEWACGDIVSAERLNKLENGLADCCGGGTELFVVGFSPSDDVLVADKTWQEVVEAYNEGKVIKGYIDALGKTELATKLETEDGELVLVSFDFLHMGVITANEIVLEEIYIGYNAQGIHDTYQAYKVQATPQD